jgi:peptide/nickel transport system substrate-binding protein
MVRNSRRTRRARVALAAAATLLVAAVAACSGSTGTAAPSPSASPSATGAPVPGGTARVALPVGVTPDWIWPYTPSAHDAGYNTQGFQRLLYRPLYMFGDDGTGVTVNYPLSPASAPVYSEGGKTVTITMKGWKWSDGEPVDASDVIFWLNMMKAEPAGYYGYVPGQLPDNLASYAASGPDTVVLRLKSAVSVIWFTYDQLSQITPMPAAWDVTAAGAGPGSGGCAADTAADHWAKCAAVFDFLTAQAGDARSYAASPLWGVVDGPWKLSGFTAAATGQVASFVPNPAYSGSPKPQLSGFTYDAYTSDRSEYIALKSGQLDVGYVPYQYLPPVPVGQALPASSPLGGRYALSPAYSFDIQYLAVNFGNPALGPVFRQAYVRQALQELVDQDTMITAAWRGYGYPGTGGVPAQPLNPWVPPVESVNNGLGPYPFSIANAMSLLTTSQNGAATVQHGWREVGGVMTCVTPAECGRGIAAGTKLSLTLDYPQGVPSVQQEVTLLRADAAQAGIRITLVPRSPAALSREAAGCQSARGRSAQAGCGWDLLDTGGWNFTGAGYEPTGQSLFATGGVSNAGGYSDPNEDTYIGLTRTNDSLSVYQNDYATYTANDLPVIWLPDFYSVTAVSSRLASVGNSPVGTLLPEYWFFTK